MTRKEQVERAVGYGERLGIAELNPDAFPAGGTVAGDLDEAWREVARDNRRVREEIRDRERRRAGPAADLERMDGIIWRARRDCT